MATRKRNTNRQINQVQNKQSATPPQTGKVFVGEEDKRMLKKLNKHIVNKLGLQKNRSVVL